MFQIPSELDCCPLPFFFQVISFRNASSPKISSSTSLTKLLTLPITMHINTAIFGQQIPHQNQPFVDHCDEGIRALAPGIAVGDFFQDVRLLGEGIAADLDVHGKIRAHIEGRVDVDQLETALLFDLLAQRAVFQDGEDQLVVSPDQLVGPALELAAAVVKSNRLSCMAVSDGFSARGSSTCSIT